MTVDQADQLLDRLGSTAESIGAKLVDLENDATRLMLEHAALRGMSRSRWSAARATLGDLWRWYAELTSVLDRATDLRRTRPRGREREADLLALLTEPSIAITTVDLTFAGRSPSGHAEEVTRCSPEDLVHRMTEAFDRVIAVIARADHAWSGQVARLQEARAALAEVEEAAQTLGDVDVPELASARSRLDRLAKAVLDDPLCVDDADLDSLEQIIARLNNEIEAAAQLRSEVGGRLTEARRLLEQLAEAIRDAGSAHREATQKIAPLDIPAPPRNCGDLQARLDNIVSAVAGHTWREAARSLAHWSADASAELERVRACEAQSRQPIETRNELRARLEAYSVKAARLDRIEDETLTSAYDRAWTTLYTAPTDLDAAAALVSRYQGALVDSSSRSGPR